MSPWKSVFVKFYLRAILSPRPILCLCAMLSPCAILYARANLTATGLFSV